MEETRKIISKMIERNEIDKETKFFTKLPEAELIYFDRHEFVVVITKRSRLILKLVVTRADKVVRFEQCGRLDGSIKEIEKAYAEFLAAIKRVKKALAGSDYIID